MNPASEVLPAGWSLVRELASGSQGRVLLAERAGERGVIRVVPRATAHADDLAELSVLARVRHPGLAQLLDHGELPERGGVYTIRSWIEGSDLTARALTWRAEGAAGALEIGRVVARLCPALEHLHRAGFVHGDLKPGNVIVTARGEPVLTDFGLARTLRSGRAGTSVSGTLFAVAPEVLLGVREDARADLFALGVLLHELLIARRASAREFYAAFPEQDFFAATRTRVEELPEWARDVTARLLARDPASRPSTAGELARALAARVHIALPDVVDPRVAWPARRGRESFFANWVEVLRAEFAAATESASAAARISPVWVQVTGGDDPASVLDELRISLALAGSPSLRIDLERSGRELGDELALDAWVRAQAAAARSAIAFVALKRDSAWDVRRVEGLARALAHASVPGDHDPTLLVVVAQAPAPASEFGWKPTPLPPIARDEIVRQLELEFEDEPARIAELADVLCAAASGGAASLDAVLAELAERGTFVRGDHGRRLRPGPIVLVGRGDSGRAPPDTRLVSKGALALYAALSISGHRATFDELAAIAGIPLDVVAQCVDELVAQGWAELRSEAGALELRARAFDTSHLGISPQRWRELHASRAALLRARGAHPSEWLPDEWRGAPGSVSSRAIEAELSALREAGLPERALGLFESVRALAESAELELEPGLLSEAAQAWIALGRADRARELAERLSASPGERPRALAAFVHGGIALLRHDWTEATACFDRAEALDPGQHAGVLLCRAQMYWEAGDDASIASLWTAVQRREHGELTARSLAVLDTIRAMSLFRRGDHTAARAALEAGLEAAQRDQDAGREAGLRLNLATIARRSDGDPVEARTQSERAAALYERAGNVRGLAQARVLLAGVLREQGELLRATPLLTSSHELRERLGDVAGAATVRGNLGLLLADRGHVLASRHELESAARASRAGGRSVHAALFEARAAEVAARYAPTPAPAAARKSASESARAAEADPRNLVAAARRAWLCGDVQGATDSARRSRDLAAKLGQPVPGAEARLLLAWLRCTGERSIDAHSAAPLEDEVHSAPLVHEDRTLLALLSEDLAAAESARRAWDLTRALAARGRDDRAARLALALLARRAPGVSAAEARTVFDTCFARCGAGLRATELEHLRGTLLGIPDPWPADLAWRADSTATDEELDMDVVTLLDINHKLVQQEALKDLLGTIVESALAVTGAERGFLVLEEDGELSFDTALDSRRGDIAAPDLEISTSIVRQTLDAGRVLRLSNAVDDPLLGSAPSVSALELRSILCAPVAVDERLRGVIYLDHRLQQGAFAERAERLLALLADQAALAIRQVRRIEEIKRLNRELSKQMAHKESDLRTARAALRDAQLPLPTSGMVGSSPAMRAVHALVERAAPAKLSVLVSGDSGTGKELVARALHALSPRRNGPFVSENCAALPAALIESELFGYKKGAFTGAEQDRTGLFERAHGGTLFLDEIGELPLELQAKLLRVLETSEVRRVGDANVRQVDFRLVAATNRDLAAEIAGGRFRADLYYRLDGLRIALPPLSERVADIPELVEHFLRIEAAKSGRERRMAPAVLARLCRRAWPGNVRELANEVARLCVLSEGDVVAPELVREPGAAAPGQRGADTLLSGELPTMDELERRAILRALELCDGDKRRAAEMLGISRAKVYQRLKDWRGGEGEGGGSDDAG